MLSLLILKIVRGAAQLLELLLFMETHHGLSSEYDEHQHHLAKLLNHQPLTEGLSEASQTLPYKTYDPTTLCAYNERLLKAPAARGAVGADT
jgi:hypothetical protein